MELTLDDAVNERRVALIAGVLMALSTVLCSNPTIDTLTYDTMLTDISLLIEDCPDTMMTEQQRDDLIDHIINARLA